MNIRATILALSTLTSLSQLAHADTPPPRKSGLWETVMTMDAGIPPLKMKECVDGATDAETMKMANYSSTGMGGNCSQNSMKRTSTGFETESTCTAGGSTVSSKGVFTGDFNSEYKGEVVTSYAPPINGNSGSKTSFNAKRIGDCPSDMKPGDILMANGMKMNVRESAARAEKMAKMMNNQGGGKNGAPFGGDINKAMAAAQQQMKPEDLKAMQQAMKELEGLDQE